MPYQRGVPEFSDGPWPDRRNRPSRVVKWHSRSGRTREARPQDHSSRIKGPWSLGSVPRLGEPRIALFSRAAAGQDGATASIRLNKPGATLAHARSRVLQGGMRQPMYKSEGSDGNRPRGQKFAAGFSWRARWRACVRPTNIHISVPGPPTPIPAAPDHDLRPDGASER